MLKLNSLHHLLLTTFELWLDVLRFIRLSLQPDWALAAENLFLRKQLTLYLERKVKPHRATEHLDPVASARLSAVVEVEVEAARTPPSPDRAPQTDREDG